MTTDEGVDEVIDDDVGEVTPLLEADLDGELSAVDVTLGAPSGAAAVGLDSDEALVWLPAFPSNVAEAPDRKFDAFSRSVLLPGDEC